MRIALRLANLVDNFSKFLGENILCYTILLVMFFGAYEVTARYFFNQPTNWVWEENGLLICVVAGVGAAYATAVDAHIKVDIVYSRFSRRTKAIIDLCTSILAFLFLFAIVWQGVNLSWISFQNQERTETMFAPLLYPYKTALTLGACLWFLHRLAKLVRDINTSVTVKKANGC